MTFIEPDAFRLEPLALDPTLREGLTMAVADPAWMLARQRQFGELTAHDAGSPSGAVIARETAPLTRYLPSLPTGTAGHPTDFSAMPLEALVEHERDPEAEPDALWAALSGLQYRRLLAAAAMTTPAVQAYLDAVTSLHPLAIPSADHPLLAILVGGVALDGTAVYRDLAAATGQLPAQPPIAPAAVPAVTAAAQRYVAYYEALAGGPAAGASAWDATRSEYRFSLAAPTLEGELVVEASEYDSGDLDWYALDVGGGTLQAGGDPGALTAPPQTLLPAPVTFPGMPASRLWTFDAAVNLDGLQAAAEDVGAMLVLEFALSAGDDFYVIPLALDVGTAWRITSLQVTDTFGVTTEIDAAQNIRLFVHSTGSDTSPWAVLFPAAVDARRSAPCEELDLLRDQLADRCWAVERTAPTAAGVPVDRDAAAAAARPVQPTPMLSDDALRYSLRSPVPANWYPLLSKDPDALHLQIGMVDGQPAPWGRLLTELAAVDVPGEEVTRAGRRLVRSWQYARGANGAQYLWIGRRASPAPPVASLRLEFDLAQPAAD